MRYSIILCSLFFCRITLQAQNTSFDLNAAAYIHSAHIQSATEKNAINKFVRCLKYYGIWDNIHALYIPTGGTELSHKLNLKDPKDADDAFRLFYPNGADHSINGTDWNGIDQGALTFYSPTSTRLHMMVYQDEPANETYLFSGDRDGITDFNAYTWSALYSDGIIGLANQGNFSAEFESEQTGFFYGQRFSNDSTAGYVNGLVRNKWLQPISSAYNTDTSQKIWINKGSDLNFKNMARYEVLSMGNVLDDQSVSKYYDIVQAFLSELGIQVGAAKAWPFVPGTFATDYTSAYRWTKATENAVDTAIDGAHLFSINDSLYLWGGWNGNWFPFNFNSGFVSGDGGHTWGKLGQAPWDMRHTAGYGTDKNGVGYIIGSDMQDETSDVNRKEVWKTEDGRNWTLQTNEAPWSGKLFLHGLAIKGDTLYVGGGQFGLTASSVLNDTIWRSIDGGVNWTAINTTAHQLGGSLYNNFKYFSARKKFVAFCGAVSDIDPESRIFSNQIWTSDDCITWTRENNVPFAPRQYSDMVEWDGKLWVWAGDRPAETGSLFLNLKDLWYMDKDGKWHEIGSVPVPPRHATAIAVDKKHDRIVFACGNMHTDVWYLEKSPRYSDQEIILKNDCSFIVPNFADSLKNDCNGQLNFTQSPAAGTIINSSPARTYPIQIIAGNSPSVSFLLIQKDTTKPIFSCPANRFVYLGNNCSFIVPDLVTGLNISDCSSTIASQIPAAGLSINSFNGQVQQVAITVKDSVGNTSSCNVTITAKDTTAPVFAPMQQITRSNDAGKCYARINVPVPAASDNCTNVTVTGLRSDGITYGATFPVGTTVITWKATDANGNSATCHQIVEVLDDEVPVLQNVTEISFCPVSNNIYTVPLLKISDNCGVNSITYSITGATIRSGTGTNASGVFNPGMSTITWTVTDIHGNESSFQTEVKVSKVLTATIPDVYAVPQGAAANTIYLGYGPASIELTAIPKDGNPAYSYAWSTGNVTQSIQISKPVGKYDYSVTVMDASGCQFTATKQVEVIDVHCGSNSDRVSVCRLLGSDLSSLCVTKTEAQSLLSEQAYLGICANNIVNVLSVTPADEIRNKLQVAIMPNPTSQFFTLKLETVGNKPIDIRIFDGVGCKLEEKKGINPGSLIQVGQKYPSGIYFLQVRQGAETVIFKLIKKAG